MKKNKLIVRDFLFSIFVLMLTFLLSFFIQFIFKTDTLVPTIFVLGVFFVSLRTEGYLWGVLASLIGVMLVIAIMTSTLTTQIKQQEKIKAESVTVVLQQWRGFWMENSICMTW